MHKRTRLLLSICIPVVLIIVVVSAYLFQLRAASSAQGTSHVAVTPSSPCASLNKAAPQQLTTMNLALDWTPNTNHTGIYVALVQNWYREEGIDLHLLPYSANVSPDVLVASGKADVGISATEGIVADAAVGQPVVSIAAIIQHNTSTIRQTLSPAPPRFSVNLICCAGLCWPLPVVTITRAPMPTTPRKC